MFGDKCLPSVPRRYSRRFSAILSFFIRDTFRWHELSSRDAKNLRKLNLRELKKKYKYQIKVLNTKHSINTDQTLNYQISNVKNTKLNAVFSICMCTRFYVSRAQPFQPPSNFQYRGRFRKQLPSNRKRSDKSHHRFDFNIKQKESVSLLASSFFFLLKLGQSFR